MKQFFNISILLILLLGFSFSSCNKEDESPYNEKEQNSSSDSDKGNSNNSSERYYFRVETQIGNVRPDAGSMIISIDCNQSWTLTYSGDVPDFSASPVKGSGRSSTTIKYGQAKYTETKTEITWNDKETLTFHIREGSPSNYKETTYNVYFSRRGSKMRP